MLEEVSIRIPQPFSQGSNSSSATHSLCDFGQVLNLSVPQCSHPEDEYNSIVPTT